MFTKLNFLPMEDRPLAFTDVHWPSKCCRWFDQQLESPRTWRYTQHTSTYLSQQYPQLPMGFYLICIVLWLLHYYHFSQQSRSHEYRIQIFNPMYDCFQGRHLQLSLTKPVQTLFTSWTQDSRQQHSGSSTKCIPSITIPIATWIE